MGRIIIPMIGLYLLVSAVAILLAARFAQKHGRSAAHWGLGIFLIWLFTSFWYSGGRGFYYDIEVNRLCAMDGGVKVYETVTLPPDKFTKWGTPKFFYSNRDEIQEYVYKSKRIYLRKEKPNLYRFHTEVIRKSDGKKLGESTLYGRDSASITSILSITSSYSCPREADINVLFNRIFINSTK